MFIGRGNCAAKPSVVNKTFVFSSEFKDKAPFCGFFQMFTPYLLAIDPGLIKQMFIKDFGKFRNNDFTVS